LCPISRQNSGQEKFAFIQPPPKKQHNTIKMAKLVGFLIVIFVAALSAQEQSCSNSDGFLTTDFTPSTNDVVHFFNLTEYFNSTMEGRWDGPLNFTLLESDNQTVVVNLEYDTGFYYDWGLGANGGIYIPFFGDSEHEPNSTYAIILVFNPPVTTISFKTNYDPSFNESDIGGPPLFTTYNEEGNNVNCYRVDLIAPISFNDVTTENGYEIRGVTDESGIVALRVEGAQIVIFDIKVATRSPSPPTSNAPIDTPTGTPIVQPHSMETPAVTSSAVSVVAAAILVPLVLLM
jgi:hypothetical protein